MRKTGFKSIITLSLMLLSLSPAWAVHLKLELDDVVRSSDHVVHGRVTETRSGWVEDERGRHIRTYGKIAVISHLKGGNGPEIEGEFEGGTVGDITESVSDAVSVTPGEEAVFFLNRDKKTGLYRPAAGGYSKYRIFKGKAYGLSGRSSVQEISSRVNNAELAPAAGEPQAESASSTNIYNNSTTSSYYPAGAGTEVTDFGTTTGGHVVKYTFAYVTTQSDPGTVTVKFYSGTSSSSKGTLVKTFTYSGLKGSTSGNVNALTQDIHLAPTDQFDLPNGAFGYSMTFDNANTGVWLSTGGSGETSGMWIDGTYYSNPFSGSGVYLKVEKAAATGPIITEMSPGSASAGTDTVVTISGTGFGMSQGTVNFLFKANSSTIPGIVTSWSDTIITCKIPVGTVDGYAGSAASGPVTVTTAAAATSDGYPFTVTFGYGQVKWSGTTVTYRINENTADCTGEGAAVQAAAASWNATGANFSFSYGGTTTATGSSFNGQNEILWGDLGNNSTIAQATYWYDSSNLSQADIVFNTNINKGYTWDTSGSPGSSNMDVQTIALHELGHWLNLRDLYGSSGISGNDNGKVMYGFANNGLVKRTLTTADSDGIRWIYPGSASVPTVVTPSATSVATTSATLGATIAANGGATVTGAGVAYGTSSNPDTSGSTVATGTTGGAFTVSVTGLSSNTLYHYRGYATNSAGTGYTSDATFTTIAASPMATAATGVGSTGFTATWTAPSGTAGISEYRLDVATDSGFTAMVGGYSNLSVASTSRTVSGLSSGTTYYYRVRAANAGGTSSSSGTMTVTTNAVTVRLTVTVSGTGGGSGSVNSNPAGIACTGSGAGCFANFNVSSPVTLTATPSATSVLTGWGGACNGTAATCDLVVPPIDTEVTATFGPLQLIHLFGTTTYYASLAEAYQAVAPGGSATFELRDTRLVEDLVLNRSATIVLKGGYDNGFSTANGTTVLKGSLTVTNGAAYVEKIGIE